MHLSTPAIFPAPDWRCQDAEMKHYTGNICVHFGAD